MGDDAYSPCDNGLDRKFCLHLVWWSCRQLVESIYHKFGMSAMLSVLSGSGFYDFLNLMGVLFFYDVATSAASIQLRSPAHAALLYPLPPDIKGHLVAKRKASDWLSVIATEISANYWWLLGI